MQLALNMLMGIVGSLWCNGRTKRMLRLLLA